MSNPNSPTVVAVSPTMHPPASTVVAGTVLGAGAPAAKPAPIVRFYCGICMTLEADTLAFCGETDACKRFHFCKPCLAEYYGIAIRESLGWLPSLRCPVPTCRKVLAQESWSRVALRADIERYNKLARELIPYRCPYCDHIAHLAVRFDPKAVSDAEELMVRVRRVLGNDRRLAIRAKARAYARHQIPAGALVDVLAAAYDDLCEKDGFHPDVLLSPDFIAKREEQAAAEERARRLEAELNAKLEAVEQARLAAERMRLMEGTSVTSDWEEMPFAGLDDVEFMEETTRPRVVQPAPRPKPAPTVTKPPLPSTLLMRVAASMADQERRMNLLVSICRRYPVIDSGLVQCCSQRDRFLCLECQLHVEPTHTAGDCRARNNADREPRECRMRHCPGCGVATVRTSGCSQMYCPCGINWCYACGMVYDGHTCTGTYDDESDADNDLGFDLFD